MSKSFIRELRRRGVKPLNLGRVIVASQKSCDRTLCEVIRDQGLNWHLLHNRNNCGALPAHINKGTGLAAAAREFGIRPDHIVAIGDAQNDVDLLRACGGKVAVGNALPIVRACADFVTSGQYGKGVVEAIEWLLKRDSIPAHARERRRA